jgi:type IV pilus assembly protein PilC
MFRKKKKQLKIIRETSDSNQEKKFVPVEKIRNIESIKDPKEKKRGIFSKLSTIAIGGAEEKAYMIEYLSMLIGSGMDVATSLRAIQDDLKAKWLRVMVEAVRIEIESGIAIWRALAKINFLPPHVISLVRIGEESGRLSENLQAIVVQQQKERQFKGKLRSAMMYPIFVMSLTAFVGIGIAWFILPRLATVFDQLHMELPLITRMLIATGLFLQDYGVYAVPGSIVVILIMMYILFGMKKTKFIGQWMLFIMPGIRGLIREVELSRFGFVMGTLLNAGLPIVDAVNSLKEATVFFQYKKLYGALAKAIDEGETFHHVFKSNVKFRRLVPASIQQMIITSEQTGRLPETLENIGRIFEVKTDTSTKNLAVILEPILLVVVWVGVVGVALAIVLPIYSLIGGFTDTVSVDPVQDSAEEIVTTNNDISLEDVIAAQVDQPEEPVIKMLQIIAPDGALNVYDDPNSESAIVVEVKNDEIYESVGEQDGWYEIKLKSVGTAWVLGEHVLILESEMVDTEGEKIDDETLEVDPAEVIDEV